MNMLFEVKNHKALEDAADAFCVFLKLNIQNRQFILKKVRIYVKLLKNSFEVTYEDKKWLCTREGRR